MKSIKLIYFNIFILAGTVPSIAQISPLDLQISEKQAVDIAKNNNHFLEGKNSGFSIVLGEGYEKKGYCWSVQSWQKSFSIFPWNRKKEKWKYIVIEAQTGQVVEKAKGCSKIPSSDSKIDTLRDTTFFKKEKINGWKTCDSISNFRFQYPSTWELIGSNVSAGFTILAPGEKEQNNTAHCVRLFIVTYQQSPTPSWGLTKVIAEEKQQLRKQKGFIENRKILGDTLELFTFDFSDKNEGIDMHYLSHVLFWNGTRYILTYSVKEKDFEKNKITGENLMNSFTFKNY